MPIYNKAKTIRMSLNSILDQTLQEFEILVVDDGSTDELSSVLDEYDDFRIRVFKQKNQGVSMARNKAIENSKFPYICFLDGDDIWYKNHLETMKSMIDKYPGEMMFVTSYRIVMNDGMYFDSYNNMFQIKEKIIKVSNIFSKIGTGIFHTNSVCIARDAFEKTGIFEVGVKLGEDTDMWFRVAAYFNVVLCKTVTTEYHRLHSTASRFETINFNWPFEMREDALMESNEISPEKKESICRMLDRYRVSKARHYLLNGDKGAAWKALASVKQKKCALKQWMTTVLCFLIPRTILKRGYAKKHATYYGLTDNH